MQVAPVRWTSLSVIPSPAPPCSNGTSKRSVGRNAPTWPTAVSIMASASSTTDSTPSPARTNVPGERGSPPEIEFLHTVYNLAYTRRALWWNCLGMQCVTLCGMASALIVVLGSERPVPNTRYRRSGQIPASALSKSICGIFRVGLLKIHIPRNYQKK